MHRWIASALLFFPLIANAAYLRGAIGFERSRDTTVRDADCASTQPPALFGCVAGNDGLSLAARGDFGDPASFEIGLGTELGRRTRLELSVLHRDLELDAEANFLGVEGEQPVDAGGSSLSAMVVGAIDLASTDGRVRPFVTAGAGAARNAIGDVRYAFPSIAPDAVTIVTGGARTNFAWMAGAGLSVALSPSLVLDLTFRWRDLGELRTDAGEATIIRPNRTLMLDIAGTRARVKTTGVTLAIRWRIAPSSPPTR